MEGRPTEEQQEIFEKFREKAISLGATEIDRYTVALYACQGERICVNGTGVLVQVGEKYFLVTAAHVLDFTIFHDIPYALLDPGPDGGFAHLDALACWTSPIPPSRDANERRMRRDDPFDVGYLELPEDLANRLKVVYKFVTLREMDLKARPRPGFYLVHGFPAFLSSVDDKAGTITAEPMRYVTLLADDTEDGFNPLVDIRLQYPEVGVSPDQKDVHMPTPGGISGCGIWRIAEIKPASQWKSEDIKLVGIEHMLRMNGAQRYLQGTRIIYALQAIYRGSPPSRKFMDLHFGLLTQGW
jgi:hypothetical protein